MEGLTIFGSRGSDDLANMSDRSHESIIEDVAVFLGRHTCALSVVNGHLLLPLLLVAKVVLHIKRTDEPDGLVKVRNAICRFL